MPIKYFVIPDSQDDCDQPLFPEPMSLEEIVPVLIRWMELVKRQGYFSNCRQEHIEPERLAFRLEPEDSHGFFGVISVGERSAHDEN